jgi:hypothetical protein
VQSSLKGVVSIGKVCADVKTQVLELVRHSEIGDDEDEQFLRIFASRMRDRLQSVWTQDMERQLFLLQDE